MLEIFRVGLRFCSVPRHAVLLPAVLCLFYVTVPVTAQTPEVSLSEIIDRAVVSVIAYDRNDRIIGSGTGFFVRTGHIATNWHVIERAHLVRVRDSAGRTARIPRLSYYANLDLAFLEADVSTWNPLALPLNTTTPPIGEPIFAIGDPLGLRGTVSNGIISATGRVFRGNRFHQFTAPISPGNSGGPIINRAGEVLGISTFQYTEGQNINFAIPADVVADRLSFESNVAAVPMLQSGRFDAQHAQTQPPELTDDDDDTPPPQGQTTARVAPTWSFRDILPIDSLQSAFGEPVEEWGVNFAVGFGSATYASDSGGAVGQDPLFGFDVGADYQWNRLVGFGLNLSFVDGPPAVNLIPRVYIGEIERFAVGIGAIFSPVFPSFRQFPIFSLHYRRVYATLIRTTLDAEPLQQAGANISLDARFVDVFYLLLGYSIPLDRLGL